jgi:RimJ/RimL family protein N-acetyltransferase
MAQSGCIGYRCENRWVELRRPTRFDARALWPLWQDPDVMRYLGGVCDAATAEARFKHHLDHWERYEFGLNVVTIDTDARAAGLCGLTVVDQFPEQPVELSFLFFPWAWRQRLAFSAASLVLQGQAVDLRLSEVVAITQQANSRSRILLERLRFSTTRSLVMWGAAQCWYVRKLES